VPDLAHDEADRAGKKRGCPVPALWGTSGLPANAELDPLCAGRESRGNGNSSPRVLPRLDTSCRFDKRSDEAIQSSVSS